MQFNQPLGICHWQPFVWEATYWSVNWTIIAPSLSHVLLLLLLLCDTKSCFEDLRLCKDHPLPPKQNSSMKKATEMHEYSTAALYIT